MKKMRLISGWAKAELETDLWDNNSDILCIVDNGLLEDLTPYTENIKIAVLWEPPVINHKTYEYVKQHHDDFSLIFTHDPEILKYKNARPLVNWCVWCSSDSVKDKDVSMITSNKRYCDLHNERLYVAEQLKNFPNVDVYGPIDESKDWVEPLKIHEHYKFEVVIENYIDDYWFTEKILNCFACKTIPIYYGAKKLGDYFNIDGVIQIDSPRQAIEIVRNLNFEEEYKKRMPAILDNFEKVKKYSRLGDWLLDTYKKELEDIFKKEGGQK